MSIEVGIGSFMSGLVGGMDARRKFEAQKVTDELRKRELDLEDRKMEMAAKAPVASLAASPSGSSPASASGGAVAGGSSPEVVGGAAGLLRKFEGFQSKPYWDVNAHRIGYGSDTVTSADGRIVPVQPGMSVSREDAERDLQRRLDTEFTPRAASAVGGKNVWNALSPRAQHAMLSVTYNYGSLPKSVVMAAGQGDEAIANAIRGLSGHNDGVNAKRRNQEADYILGGARSAPPAEAPPPVQPPARGIVPAQPEPSSGALATTRAAFAKPLSFGVM